METFGRRPFRKGNRTSNEPRGRPTSIQPRRATAREGSVSRMEAQSGCCRTSDDWASFQTKSVSAEPIHGLLSLRDARSFDSSIRPSWSGGQPVLHHDFNSGHPFVKFGKFGPDLVKFSLKFSLEKSEIFAHVAAEVTDLAANA